MSFPIQISASENDANSTFAFQKILQKYKCLSLGKHSTNDEMDASDLWYAQDDGMMDNNAVLVIFGQTVTLALLSALLTELKLTRFEFYVTANRFNQSFGSAVINICFSGNKHDLHNIENTELLSLCTKYRVEISRCSNVALSRPGLALFDMDSTIIEMECIDEIAKLAGVGDDVAQVTERAMRGEIAFGDSLVHRVACLEGVEVGQLLSIQQRLPFSPGFLSLVTALKSHGWKVAIASGGFTYFADYIKDMFELDYAASNTLQTSNGKLTGRVSGEIVDASKKAQLLISLAERYHIPAGQTLAIGDGANDLEMMSCAAFGVAYHAKPAVQEKANGSIHFAGLEAVLYMLT